MNRSIPETTHPLPARAVLDKIDWQAKAEAHRLAIANRNKSWARRWLRANREWRYANGKL